MSGSPRWSIGRILLFLGRLALAAVFLLAAYGKLRPQTAPPFSLVSLKVSPSSLKLSMAFFAMQVDSYQLLPGWAVNLFARVLPWVELALGVLLIIGCGLRLVALISTALLALFFAVVIRTYALHLSINCGCFGPNETLNASTLARDGSLLALGVAVTLGAFLRKQELAPVAAASERAG